MNTEPTDPSPLEQSLESLQKAVEAWDPEEGAGAGEMLAELREVQLHFDPRKSRLQSTLCLGSMRLLEEVERHGAVPAEAAVEVVRELTEQLRQAFAAPPREPTSAFRMLKSSATSPAEGAGTELKLVEARSAPSLSLVDDLRVGEMMVKMSILSQEDCDRALRAQAENLGARMRFGETCVAMGLINHETLQSVLRMQEQNRSGPDRPALELDDDPWGQSPL